MLIYENWKRQVERLLVCSLFIFIKTNAYIHKSNHRDVEESPQRMWDPENGLVIIEDGQKHIIDLEDVTITNKTVQLGMTAFLNCHVRNMADKKVSWIRQRDNHILTSGLQVYSSDERFSVMRPEGSDDWALQIKFVQLRDEGKYECQVATKEGSYGHLVNLHIVVPEAKILGPPDLHVQSGSTIFLICIIEGSITPPQYVFWYRNNVMINYDQERRGIQVHTEHKPKPTSKLTITSAVYKDTGNYTCSASNTKSASVNVFVSEGDKTAAIQRLDSASPNIYLHSLLLWWIASFIPNFLLYKMIYL